MKLASKILGALVIVMLIVVTALTFLQANTLVKSAAQTGGGGSGDVVDTITDLFSLAMSLIGYAGFILMNAFGAVLIIYLICFCVSYGKLYKAKSNPSFIRYSAITSGVILFFECVLFVCKPSAGWQAFTVILISAALMIAYAAVSIKYLSSAEKHKSEIKYDIAPVFPIGDEIDDETN